MTQKKEPTPIFFDKWEAKRPIPKDRNQALEPNYATEMTTSLLDNHINPFHTITSSNNAKKYSKSTVRALSDTSHGTCHQPLRIQMMAYKTQQFTL